MVNCLISAAAGVFLMCLVWLPVYCLKDKKNRIVLANKEKETDKNWDQFQLLNHWIMVKNSGEMIAEFFKEAGYQKVAIYGMSDLGARLYEELKIGDIEVVYGIDREPTMQVSGIKDVYTPNDTLPYVDAIIVTPIYDFDRIKETLSKNCSYEIISLEEVIWSL